MILPVFTNSASDGIVNQQDYFDREIVSKNSLASYSIVDYDDFIYNPRVSTSSPVGPISRNQIGRGIMSPLYTVFRFQKGYVVFYEHFFKTNCWHRYLKDNANYGARYDRMNITNDVFMNMPIPFPPFSEQRRIADSLSSFDEMTNYNIEKYNLLKQFKQGLIQQLFLIN